MVNNSLLEIKIVESLSSNRVGLTISEIARIVGVSRNTVAKYLQTLEAKGEVVHKRVASAKLFYLSSRVKETRLIDLFRTPMVVINNNLEIIISNRAFHLFVELIDHEIHGKRITKIIETEENMSFYRIVEEMIKGKKKNANVRISFGNEQYAVNLVPVVLKNGQTGLSILFDILC